MAFKYKHARQMAHNEDISPLTDTFHTYFSKHTHLCLYAERRQANVSSQIRVVNYAVKKVTSQGLPDLFIRALERPL